MPPNFGITPAQELLQQLEIDDPGAVFQGFLGAQGPSGNMRNFFEGEFRKILDEFKIGLVGESQRTGELPTQSFSSFLNQFDFQNRFASAAPSLAGRLRGRFAPQTQFFSEF